MSTPVAEAHAHDGVPVGGDSPSPRLGAVPPSVVALTSLGIDPVDGRLGERLAPHELNINQRKPAPEVGVVIRKLAGHGLYEPEVYPVEGPSPDSVVDREVDAMAVEQVHELGLEHVGYGRHLVRGALHHAVFYEARAPDDAVRRPHAVGDPRVVGETKVRLDRRPCVLIARHDDVELGDPPESRRRLIDPIGDQPEEAGVRVAVDLGAERPLVVSELLLDEGELRQVPEVHRHDLDAGVPEGAPGAQ